MSNAHLDAIFADRTLVGGERLVMIVLANRANGDDTCWPSRERIANEAGLTTRQVRRIIPKLIAAGYIELMQEANGRGNTCHYRLSKNGDTMSPLAEQKGDICATERGTSAPVKGDMVSQRGTFATEKGDIASHTREEPNEPSLEPKEEQQGGTPRAHTRTITRVLSPHFRASDFRNGYIPPGTGANAVQVYYERFDIRHDRARLSAPQEDDLNRLCPDLDHLRDVITAYSQTSYRPGNVRLILDWYRGGIPQHQSAGSGNGAAPRTKVARSLAASEMIFARLEQEGIELCQM